MAQTTLGIYGRLKDQRISVSERLILARDVWDSESEVLPNKHQVIIDVIVGFLLNKKKRSELSESEENVTWETLFKFLGSPAISQPNKYGSTLLIKPSLTQILLETLEILIGKCVEMKNVNRSLLCHVVGCCHVILKTPALAYILTSRYDTIVAVSAVICQMGLILPVEVSTEMQVPALLSALCEQLWLHYHSESNQSHVLRTMTDKLLLLVVILVHQTHSSPHFSIFADSSVNLKEFILGTLFHEEHERLFKTYLDIVTKQQEASQIPKLIDGFFSKLRACLHSEKNAKCDPEKMKLEREATLHFFPLLFRHAAATWQKNPHQSFQLCVHLMGFLGIQFNEVCAQVEEDCLEAMADILTVVKDFGVYNVAADRAGDGTQLKFFQQVQATLLSTKCCQSLCQSLSVLLKLNHLILESNLPQILNHCCSHMSEMTLQTRTSLDFFLKELILTYSQLHQIPKCLGFLLTLNKQCPQELPLILSLQNFIAKFREVIASLPQKTSLEIWNCLQEEVIKLFQEEITRSQGTSENDGAKELWGVTLIFHEFVSRARLFDAGMMGRVVDRVQSMVTQLEAIFTQGLQDVSQHLNEQLACRSILLLELSLGNLKLILAQYRTFGASPQQFSISSADFPFSLEHQELLIKKKAITMDPVVQFLLDCLAIQRLQVSEPAERMKKLTGWQSYLHMNEQTITDQRHATWDENLSSITESNYLLAKFYWLTHSAALLLPTIIQENCTEFAMFIINIFAHCDEVSEIEPRRITLLSVALNLLHNTCACDSKELHHQLLCCFWQKLATLFSSSSSCNSKKKRTSSICLQSALQALEKADVTKCEKSERQIQDVVNDIITVLGKEIIQPVLLSKKQASLLKILNHLPLAYLGATSQLHCILGLLLLLHHQKKTLFSHNSLATVIKKKSISDISDLVTDKNELSKGVMQKHSSKYFNRMFILSSSKENLMIENNVVDPKTGRGLVGVHGQAQGKLGDELCRLLTVLFDASAGTSVFCHISPTVLLNCLVALCLKVKADEDSPLGRLLQKTVSTVMSDFQSMMELKDFVRQLTTNLRNITQHLKQGELTGLNHQQHQMTFLLTSYMLLEMQWHLKKDFYRQDVQAASRSYFLQLSSALDQLIDVIHGRKADIALSALSPFLLRCFTLITVQRCLDAKQQSGEKQEEFCFLEQVKFILEQVTNYLSQENDQGIETEGYRETLSANLMFLSSVFAHGSVLSNLLTPETTRVIWDSLLSQLHSDKYFHKKSSSWKECLADNVTGCSDVISQIRISTNNIKTHFLTELGHVVTPNGRKRSGDKEGDSQQIARKKARVSGLDSTESHHSSVGDIWAQDSKKEEKLIQRTLIDVIAGCEGLLFSDLLENLVNDMSPENMIHPARIRQSAFLWQKLVTCFRLTVEQKNILGNISIRYLLHCLSVMTEVCCSANHYLIHVVGVPILDSVSEMLTVDQFLLSQGTALALEICSLMPLGGHRDFAAFFPAFHSMYNLLHAVMVHHPYTALKVIPAFVNAAKSLLKGCIEFGDQNRLLMNAMHSDNMVRCAECVSRLLTLLAGNRKELHRVAVYVVADYVNWVKSLTLLPAVKKALLPGVYAFLDLCDKHAMTQLRTMLPPGVREVFHLLHNNYLKYYKYKGKV